MTVRPLRIVFAGTPEFAAIHLRGLIAGPHTVVAVLSQPDRHSGRGKKITPSPVTATARAEGIKVLQPASLRDDDSQEALAQYQADVIVVVAFGLILPSRVLNIPRYGCINVHASLLPRWRGAAPIQRAIEAGDKESGITIMQMEAGLDTGPMLNQTRVAITGAMTGGELHDALASVGPAALDEVLLDLPGAIERAERQNDSLASYAHKLSKPEMAIGWTDHADLLARRIQAFSPMPGCYGLLDGTRIKFLGGKAVSKDSNAAPGTILEASQDGLFVACAEGQLCITRAQLPGGRPMTTTELLNGQQDRFRIGSVFQTARVS